MFKPAVKNNRILRSQQVLSALIAVVRPYLPLDLQNTRITADDIIAILGYASANRISMDAACHELKEAPSANRLREVLAPALPDRATLQRALNRILRAQTPRFVKKGKRAYYIAIDLTLIPYHGECYEEEKEIVRSQAKSGTTHFHGRRCHRFDCSQQPTLCRRAAVCGERRKHGKNCRLALKSAKIYRNLHKTRLF